MHLNRTSIGYLKEGQSGVYLATLLERLGIGEAIASKVTHPDTDSVSELVAKRRNRARNGCHHTDHDDTGRGTRRAASARNSILHHVYRGGEHDREGTRSGQDLLKFLRGPAVLRIMTLQGMEPAN